MAKGDVTTGAPALTVATLQERIALCRRLLALATEQHHQAKLNSDLALTGLSQLEIELGGGK